MDNFIGEIRMFAGTYAPVGWHLCDGSMLAIQGNDALFSLLGTLYGGDGSVNFGLPDLRGKIPVGSGQLDGGSKYLLGAKGGMKDVTIDIGEMTSHSHTLNAANVPATTGNPSNNMLAVTNGVSYNDGVNLYVAPITGLVMSTMNANSITYTGGNQSHNNLQPCMCLNYIIATTGLYPPQS